ncbi:MAG: peptidoglycan DD-metalloendopeptidase family protein [Rhizobacter sp.]|nr:peptidoglycan DD-metalloendopeptidase family protein [Chlorobiales bacterium]
MPMPFNQRIAATALALTLTLLVWGTAGRAVASESESQKIARQRKQTEQNLKLLQKQVQEYASRLGKASTEEQRSLQALSNLDRQLKVYNELIGELEVSQSMLRKQIAALRVEIVKAETALAKMKEDFAIYAVGIYKLGIKNDAELLFSAGSINQALVRTEYIKRFELAGKLKITDIARTQAEIAVKAQDLALRYAEDKELLDEKRTESAAYQSRKAEREKTVAVLRQNKQSLKEQIERSQSSAKQLQNKIAELMESEDVAIRAELKAKFEAARRKKLSSDARKSRPTESSEKFGTEKSAAEKSGRRSDVAIEKPDALPSLKASPDDFDYSAVSADFDENRGRLPWPVKGGVIVQAFGRNENKDLKIVSFNNGVDISVPTGADIFAVSGGKVTLIYFNPVYGNVVIVRHSNSYLTAYANLSQVRVEKGETVIAGQTIGLAGRGTTAGAVVHFEIWQRGEKHDPEIWLAKK